jgi:DNA replication protein DnaD
MKGWLKLYRQLINSSIWIKSSPEHKVIWITLLIMTNHTENITIWKGEKHTVLPGQFITTLEEISEYAGKGIKVSHIRTTLKKFEKLGLLTNESAKAGRLITIVNWNLYQLNIQNIADNSAKDYNLISTNMKGGWIKIHRKIIYSSMWRCSNPKPKVILVALLLSANYYESKWVWKGDSFNVKPGQFITSLKSIMRISGKDISIKNIRTALSNFEQLDFLTNESTKTGRLITIVNWELYQSEEVNCTDKPTNNRQTSGNELAPNKNNTKTKNEIQEIYDYYMELDLVKHRNLTEGMKRAVKKAKKEYNLTVDELKRMLKRHEIKIKETAHSEYKVKTRGLAAFFGQKKHGSTELICADYLDEYYNRPEIEKPAIEPIVIKDTDKFL